MAQMNQSSTKQIRLLELADILHDSMSVLEDVIQGELIDDKSKIPGSAIQERPRGSLSENLTILNESLHKLDTRIREFTADLESTLRQL